MMVSSTPTFSSLVLVTRQEVYHVVLPGMREPVPLEPGLGSGLVGEGLNCLSVVFVPGGPALHPLQGARGFMGVCTTVPHVFCGPGEGIRPSPSWYPVGDAPGVHGQGPSSLCTSRA
ncbi:hypothetical protein XENORESO_017428 [Xenotaenia resolanae]|uniref:Uncharacterized protein n=1 Tax=Xenotaenia resolanae TaxID=208358 RepID=A0ABV0WYR7_9TELE